MNQTLTEAVVSLLESGDDEGCDGLVVVTAKAYGQLRTALAETQKQGTNAMTTHTETRLPYVVHVEVDGEIISSLRDHSADDETAIRHTAKHVKGFPQIHAHLRHAGRYIAEIATNVSGEVFCEHHTEEVMAGGALVVLLYRISDDGVMIPLYDEFVQCFS